MPVGSVRLVGEDAFSRRANIGESGPTGRVCCWIEKARQSHLSLQSACRNGKSTTLAGNARNAAQLCWWCKKKHCVSASRRVTEVMPTHDHQGKGVGLKVEANRYCPRPPTRLRGVDRACLISSLTMICGLVVRACCARSIAPRNEISAPVHPLSEGEPRHGLGVIRRGTHRASVRRNLIRGAPSSNGARMHARPPLVTSQCGRVCAREC